MQLSEHHCLYKKHQSKDGAGKERRGIISGGTSIKLLQR